MKVKLYNMNVLSEGYDNGILKIVCYSEHYDKIREFCKQVIFYFDIEQGSMTVIIDNCCYTNKWFVIGWNFLRLIASIEETHLYEKFPINMQTKTFVKVFKKRVQPTIEAFLINNEKYLGNPASERYKPKKPVKYGFGVYCSNCDSIVSHDMSQCECCGQYLDWSEV